MSEQCPKCKSFNTEITNGTERAIGGVIGIGLPVAGMFLGGPIGGAVGAYISKAGRYQLKKKECRCKNCGHRFSESW